MRTPDMSQFAFSLMTMRMMHCSLNVSMIDYQHEMSDNTFYTVKMIKYFCDCINYPVCCVIPAFPSRPGASFLLMPANNFLISAIARPGFKPFGQVLVQFIMV